ncbi:MAG: protein kinase [Desulfomonile tiedjei]|uniref:Protein kinase n=1 Tax=Desulfomonile tiedjei TaxID=2358 RepID=A0A9D6Z2E2_9BACT|nr:protein kinase [Desulfomonile tiedjei]
MTDSHGGKEEISQLWQEAEFYENQGLYEHAILLYQNILTKEPKNRKAQAKIVQVQFAKKMDETTASRSSETDELSPRLALDLGVAYMEMHLYAEALDEFKKALKPSPVFRTEILRFTAMCLIHMDKVAEAQQIIDQLLEDRTLTITDRGGLFADCIELYLECGLRERALDLFHRIPEDHEKLVRDYDRLKSWILVAQRPKETLELVIEEEDTGRIYTEPLDFDVLDEMDKSGERELQKTQPSEMSLSIPLKAPRSYSLDNNIWRDGVVSRLSADWALVHLPEKIDLGESMVLQLHLPTVANEPVWVISRIARHFSGEEDAVSAGTRVQFVSFLPGGESILKSFIDEVVRDPSALSEKEMIAASRHRNESTEVFASLEAQAVKALETEFLPELNNETVLIEPEVKASAQAAAFSERERDAVPKIRFACECGQVHSVPLDTVGRKGKCGNCGRSMTVPAVDMRPDSLAIQVVGKIVGGCRLLFKIGGGGMGGVFKGHHIALDIPVAVKILHAHLADKDPVFIKRFIREARAAAKLQHPNIVGVMNVGFENGLHFLVMPFVGGGNAAAMLARIGRYPVEKVMRIAIDVTQALIVAEDHGVLHRDIKPANLLFTNKGDAMLADLGLAKSYLDVQDSGITQTGIACGTPLYFSPEQAKGSPKLDIRSDIYSLGITLYHLLNGVPPYTGESAYVIFQKHVHEPLPPLREADPPIPDSVFRLLQKMTEKNPNNRFSSCTEMLEALEALRDEILAPREPATSPAQPKSKKGILERLGIKRPNPDK